MLGDGLLGLVEGVMAPRRGSAPGIAGRAIRTCRALSHEMIVVLERASPEPYSGNSVWVQTVFRRR